MKLETVGRQVAGMTRVYPNCDQGNTDGGHLKMGCKTSVLDERESKGLVLAQGGGDDDDDTAEVKLTVWTKSLILNCKGFTVFDNKGNLVFRVDNYMEDNKGDILLMDAPGNPILSIRRKKLSLPYCWVVYSGETIRNPNFSVTMNFNMFIPKYLARVTSNNAKLYWIEGSYTRRSCRVYDWRRRKLVVEIKRKEAGIGRVALGPDVFLLVAQPGIDTAVAMALVIVLDQMFSSFNKPFQF